MTLYFVCRVSYEHGGRLVEPIGIFETEAEAITACVVENDGIYQVEIGRRYEPGQSAGLAVRFPLYAQKSDWWKCGEVIA